MLSWTSWARRLRKVIWPRAAAREIEEEMALHIAMEAGDLAARGVPHDEARRRAQIAFGGVSRYTDEARDAWPLRTLQRIAADLRFAARSLRHSPAFTVTAVLALAVGMGATSTVFSVVDSIALRPLAVRAPESLVAIYGTQGEADLLGFSWPVYIDIRRDAPGFADILAFTEGPVAVRTGESGAASEAVWAMNTSDNYFAVLGLRPALGSFFGAGDLAAPVVVLSDAFWTSRLGRDPRVVGRTLQINGGAFTVVGVAPAQFTGTRLFNYDPALWIPAGMHPRTIPSSAGLLTARGGGRFHLVGRLRDGVTIRQAEAGAEVVARELTAAFPEQYQGLRVTLTSNRTPINPWLAPPERIALIGRLSIGGSLLVLLIACVNVGSLLIARMTVRRQEMAIRLSLGASRPRIVQQLLTESFLLASLGAIASIPIHVLALGGMQALFPDLEYASTFRPSEDTRVLLYSVLLTVGAALLFGLGPALQAAGRSVAAELRDQAGRGGARWRRVREALVVCQAMVSVLVLVAAGLFARGLQRARAIDPGFALDGAVAFTMHPELTPTYDTARTRDFYRRLDERIASLPGARSTARAAWLQLDGNSSAGRVFVEGASTDPAAMPAAELNVVSPGYFETLGTPLVEGREFATADSASAAQPAIVNEVLARRLWPGQSALGRRVRLGSATGAQLEIVGVARTSMYRTLGERPRAALWLSLDRNPRSRTTTLVRTTGPEAPLVTAIGDAVRTIDPTLPVVGLGTLRQRVSVAYASIESGAIGTIGFGAVALLLAASGIYGLTAYAVSQRRREIGIRVALGARGGAVVRLVAGRALGLTVAGAVAGGLIIALVPMGLDSMLHGVTRHDALALAGATSLFCAVALVAALIAARRAVRLEPMHVLRID